MKVIQSALIIFAFCLVSSTLWSAEETTFYVCADTFVGVATALFLPAQPESSKK